MKKILIIEDDEMLRKSFKLLLTREGYKVMEWVSSTYADKVISEFKPDIVITDHNFKPEEELGYSLALRLMEKGIKVILMSADSSIGIDAAANNLPFVQKPSPLKALLEMITEVIHG